MIAHIFNSSIVSGPETLVLPAIAKLNKDVCVIFLAELRCGERSNGPIEYAKSLGLKTHVLPVSSRFDRAAVKCLGLLFEQLSITYAHSHDVKASFYTLLAAKRAAIRPKLISTHHGVRGRHGLKPKLYEQIYSRIVLRFFDEVLAVCSSDRKILLKRGLAADKVRVHLNGVSRTLGDKSINRSTRAAWGVPEDGLVIGIVGRLAKEKGINRVISVLSNLKTEFPNLPKWSAVFIGSGPEESQLKAAISKFNLDEKIFFAGYRSNAASEMPALDLLLSLSPAEGLPISHIEAGWAGVPVFATAVDGVKDLIPDARFGFLVQNGLTDKEIASKLAQTLSDPSELNRAASRFQQRVSTHFNQERWLSELSASYLQ